MNYTPIIIPVSDSEPDYCPECGKPENIKKVCAHCGYEYKYASRRIWPYPLIVIFAMWLIISFIIWSIDGCNYHDCTFIEFIGNQWDWICDKAGKLW